MSDKNDETMYLLPCRMCTKEMLGNAKDDLCLFCLYIILSTVNANIDKIAKDLAKVKR